MYKLFTVIFSPLIDVYMLIRLMKGKEDKNRFKERFGYSTINRPEGKVIWFQCASVGESNSALPLIDKIIEKYEEEITVLITTGTITSAETINQKIKDKNNIIHQFTPIDKYFVIKRFLKHWKPDALITIESEIWPNMITMTHDVGNKVMIVNAKISEKSFNRWKKFKNLKERVFDAIDICYPQSQDDQYRLINLGIQNTIYLGNLKFDIPKLSVDNEFLKNLQESTQGRQIVLCASAHEEEKEVLVKVYNRLKNDFSDLIFIVAARHPNKSLAMYNYFIENDLRVKRKSFNEAIDLDTNIYLYDKMGDMGTLYEFSNIVLICGSLVNNIGGHNPIEAAKHKCAILTGPYISSNKSLFLELDKNNACIICSGKDEMLVENVYNNIHSLIKDETRLNELKENAINLCNKFSNVASNLANNIIVNLK